ncbi:MAG: KEOPS complex subunit Pcc1 [Candidatus Bathyarchaeota archaeon]|nr:KEOPS complex subunit Pcc1 [Candidatus Bathyarchaeota archaeon]
MSHATVRLHFSSQKRLNALIVALKPELDHQLTNRSTVNLTREGDTLILNVQATDTTALRAALNSYLRWVNSADNVLQTIQPPP